MRFTRYGGEDTVGAHSGGSQPIAAPIYAICFLPPARSSCELTSHPPYRAVSRTRLGIAVSSVPERGKDPRHAREIQGVLSILGQRVCQARDTEMNRDHARKMNVQDPRAWCMCAGDCGYSKLQPATEQNETAASRRGIWNLSPRIAVGTPCRSHLIA